MEQNIQEILKRDKLTVFTTNHDIPFILTTEERKDAKIRGINAKTEFVKWKRSGHARVLPNGRPWKVKITISELIEFVNKANTLKYYHEQEKVWREEDRIKKLANDRWVNQNYDSKYMFRLMRAGTEQMGKEFIIGPQGSQHFRYIMALCFFMGEDMRFETELGYSFKKGLWIRGDFGTGKTHAIKCLQHNKRNPIDVHSMIYISKMVRQTGDYKISVPAGRTVYIDDVGTEESESKHYGNGINWFKDFIERTDFTPQLYNRIIVTTNISDFGEIGKMYGGRVRDRIRGMFNIIDVTGPSLRK